MRTAIAPSSPARRAVRAAHAFVFRVVSAPTRYVCCRREPTEDGTMSPPQRNPEDRPVAALLAPDIVALLAGAPADLATETEEMHPADLADVAELLDRDQLQKFLAALGPARAADVLEYLDEELRTEFLESVTPRQAAELVSQMTPDDRADTLEEIDEEHADDILSEIPDRGAPGDREASRLRAGHRRRPDDDGVRLGGRRHDRGSGAGERSRGGAIGSSRGDAQRSTRRTLKAVWPA